MDISTNGPRREKTCLRGFANNKCADQPAHTRSLISAFVVRLTEIIMSRHSTSKILMLKLVSVADQANFEYHLVGNPEDSFCRDAAQIETHLTKRIFHLPT